MTKGRDQHLYFLGVLRNCLGGGDFLKFLYEIEENDRLISEFEAAVVDIDGFNKKFPSVYDFRLYRTLLYCMVRAIKPGVAVETGILHGMTSAFLLEAMESNGKGRLVSIDLPSYFEDGPANDDGCDAVLPKGKQPGWLVSERLASRWDVYLKASTEALPDLFPVAEPEIDLFIHDSDHSYENMLFELEFMWPRIRKGGVLLCDNIDMNTAFFDFCGKIGAFPVLFPAPDNKAMDRPRFAIVLKS